MDSAFLRILLVGAGVAWAGCDADNDPVVESRSVGVDVEASARDADCRSGAVPAVTQAGLTLVLRQVGSAPAGSGAVEFWFRGRLTNGRGVPVREASALVSTSEESALITGGQLDFGPIAAGASADSIRTIPIRQTAPKFDACAVSVLLNTPPTFTHPAARGVELGSTLNVQLEVSDGEGDPLTFRSDVLANGVSLDPESGKITIVARGEPRSFPIPVTVSDGVYEDSTVFDVAFYERKAASPPAAAADLPNDPLAVSLQAPGGAEVELTYDPKATGAVPSYGSCLSKVVACAKTNNVGSVPECVSKLERCADDTGGKNCCAPACIDKFDTLIDGAAPVMQALQDSFFEGSCQKGLR